MQLVPRARRAKTGRKFAPAPPPVIQTRALKSPISNEPHAASVKEISKWIRLGATANGGQPECELKPGTPSSAPAGELHAERIQFALHRAKLKTFVGLAKPFRRLRRNQGAVNDSLILAIHHLAAQNQDMAEELKELRGLIGSLQSQLRRTPYPAGADNSDACESS